MIFLTDVAGWLSDPADAESVISETTAAEVEAAMPAMSGGMRPKLKACVDAIHGGVHFAHIIDGRAPALAPARALHGRRHRDEGATRGMSDALMRNYARFPVEFVRGEGVRLWDSEGNEYLDFLTGISVCNTGHCHPKVVAAVQDQVARLMHVGNLYYTRPMVELAERLAARSLGGRVYFANSGAEANEAALKLVRKARPRGEIVVLHGGFHGRTYGALSATPQEAKQAPFAPLVPGFVAVAPDAAAIDAAVGERTAAVLLEPVQGESGVNLIDTEVLARGPRRLRPRRAPRSSSTRSRPAWAARARSGPTRPRASSPTR